MAFWNSNDREESKPTWLNRIQKRLCTRTIRGWELPLEGSSFARGVSSNAPVYTELLVAAPVDPDQFGAVNATAHAYRGNTARNGQGATFGSESQFRPYFATPFNGDIPASATGAPVGGPTHSYITYVVPGVTGGAGIGYQYGVNSYGASTLGGLTGVTAYIKIVANDSNFTQNLTIGLSGTYNGMTLRTGGNLTAGTDALDIPVAAYKAFFGATADRRGNAFRQDNIAVLIVGGQTAWGSRTVDLLVNDNSSSNAIGVNGITGATGFARFTMYFDRNAGLTNGLPGTGATSYYWLSTSSQ